jgi:hypothetical protein
MTEQEKYVRAAAVIFRDALVLLNERSRKYTGEGDPFANFKESADVADVDVTHGIMSRFGDKLGRIKQGLREYRDGDPGEKFADESFRDSVLDGINYLTILLLWIETNGGDALGEFVESAGFSDAPPEQQKLFEAEEEEEKGWFSKLIS